jgi:hypothetical protein
VNTLWQFQTTQGRSAGSSITDWVKRSEAVILVEYTGANMKSIDAIRAKIRETGGEFHMVKNTLAAASLQIMAWNSLLIISSSPQLFRSHSKTLLPPQKH